MTVTKTARRATSGAVRPNSGKYWSSVTSGRGALMQSTSRSDGLGLDDDDDDNDDDMTCIDAALERTWLAARPPTHSSSPCSLVRSLSSILLLSIHSSNLGQCSSDTIVVVVQLRRVDSLGCIKQRIRPCTRQQQTTPLRA